MPSPFQRGTPVTDLGTDIENPFHLPFHGLQESIELSKEPFLVSPVSHHYGTPQVSRVSYSRSRSIPKRQEIDLCCHMYLYSTGILTCFPFDQLLLGLTLGPTNPQLIRQTNAINHVKFLIVAEEPWPLRQLEFSSNLCCYYWQDSCS